MKKESGGNYLKMQCQRDFEMKFCPCIIKNSLRSAPTERHSVTKRPKLSCSDKAITEKSAADLKSAANLESLIVHF